MIDPVSGDRIESEDEARETAILAEHDAAEARMVEEEIRHERANWIEDFQSGHAA